jgi:hypothetical protein
VLDGDRPAGDATIATSIETIAAAGFDTVRLPVTWPHSVDPAFFARVERAVDAALARGLDVVLDVHRFEELSAGEFGTIAAAPMADRAAWTACVRGEAERLGVPWCLWDFGTEFGAYDTARGAWHEPLRAALLR